MNPDPRTPPDPFIQALQSPAFQAQLLANPRQALESLHTKLPEHMAVEVLQETPDRLFLLLPNQPAAAWPLRGFAVAAGWFGFGLSLLVVVPCCNWLLPTRIRPYKGGDYALEAVPWFLKAMGMRIGRGAFINTEQISDPGLISLGDGAVVGGSVRIFAHYGGGAAAAH